MFRRGGSGRLFRKLFEAQQIVIRDLYAQGFFFSPLDESVFDKNRFPGVCGKRARGGKLQIACAVVDFDPPPNQRLISPHEAPVWKPGTRASMVPRLPWSAY